jgi:diguanylate cyclase (GGDEF)-like protein
MGWFRKKWVGIFTPGGIVFLAAVGFLRPNGLPAWIQPPIAAFRYIVLAFGLLFGWYLSSSRLILSFLVLALADSAVVSYAPSDPDLGQMEQRLFAATAFLLPLKSAGAHPDRRTSHGDGARCSVALPATGATVLCGVARAAPQADLAGALQHPLMSAVRTDWSILPQPALCTFLLSGLLIGLRFAVEKNPLDGGALWGLAACFAGLQGLAYGWAPTRFFAAAGLILFLTLIQWSHRRAYGDDLTGLPGKVAFMEAAARLPQRYALAIIGMDQLRHYGHRYGKLVSEQLLRIMAPKIHSAAGQGQVYRLSGEEFTILFLNLAATDTLIDLEAVRKMVEHSSLWLKNGVSLWEASAIPQSDSEPLVLTASVGVAEAGEAPALLQDVTKAAYRALYEAKAGGGNLVKRGTILKQSTTSHPREGGRIIA